MELWEGRRTFSAFLELPSVALRTCRVSRKALTSSCGFLGDERNSGIPYTSAHYKPHRLIGQRPYGVGI